jgi:hypothetical protein
LSAWKVKASELAMMFESGGVIGSGGIFSIFEEAKIDAPFAYFKPSTPLTCIAIPPYALES